MNIDDKRHKLLGLLTKQRNDLELKKAKDNSLGVPFNKIYKELDCNEYELQLITSELYTSDEIGYHDAHNIVGLFAKKNGKTAYANKKYKRRISDRKKERVKFILLILAFIISLASLYFSNMANIRKSTFDTENKELKNKIDTLEFQVKELKNDLKTHPNVYKNNNPLGVSLTDEIIIQ